MTRKMRKMTRRLRRRSDGNAVERMGGQRTMRNVVVMRRHGRLIVVAVMMVDVQMAKAVSTNHLQLRTKSVQRRCWRRTRLAVVQTVMDAVIEDVEAEWTTWTIGDADSKSKWRVPVARKWMLSIVPLADRPQQYWNSRLRSRVRRHQHRRQSRGRHATTVEGHSEDDMVARIVVHENKNREDVADGDVLEDDDEMWLMEHRVKTKRNASWRVDQSSFPAASQTWRENG